MRATLAFTLCLIAPCAAYSQGSSFEVASVKPNLLSKTGGEGSRREHVSTSPGSLNMRNVSLSSCIQWAYDIGEYQITGPNWLGGERFDIVAKAAGPAKEDELKPMLQALLADRFKLAAHRETKVMSVYILSLAKNGSKMQQSQGDGEPGINPIRGKEVIGIQRTSMSLLTRMLQSEFHMPVLDQTGLKGNFDFTVDLTGFITKNMQPEDAMSATFKILQEQLGLKLEPKKNPVEMLIIDHIEKVPTEN